MKIRIKYIIFFLLSWISISSYAQTPFYTFLDGWRGVGVIETNDNIYTVSNHQEIINGNASAWFKVNKVSQDGTVLTVKNFGIDSATIEDANVGSYNVVSFEEGKNWMMSNYNTTTLNKNYRNVYKLNNNLDTIKTILVPFTGGTNENGELKNIKNINDTTLIVVGYSTSISGGYFIRVMSMDTLGVVNWQTDIFSSEPTIGTFMNSFQISESSDGGYFISCLDRPDLPNIGDDNLYYLLVKLNSEGFIEWKKRINDGNHVSVPGAVVQKDSNSYLISWAESWLVESPNWLIRDRSGIDSASVWLGEIDLQGNFKWKKNLYNTAINCDTLIRGTVYYPYNIIKLHDGNYLVCVDFDVNDATYIKVQPNGDIIWNRRINLFEEENADVSALHKHLTIKYTTESQDGGILGVGEYYSGPGQLFPNGIMTSVLIKLDKYGCLEPGCHLEGCTDINALNYNPEAVYDCGCIYDPCPEEAQITIDVRQNRIMSNTDFYLKEVGIDEKLIEHSGYFPSFYNNFKESICIPNDCEKEYELYINIRGNVSPNEFIPFENSDPLSLGYYAYFKVLINDSVIMNIGNELIVGRDTTILLSNCTPSMSSEYSNFKIYPNPTQEQITLEVPTEIYNESNTLSYKVVDILGREVKKQNIHNPKTTILIQNMSIGIYTIIVYGDEKPLFNQKIIKQ